MTAFAPKRPYLLTVPFPVGHTFKPWSIWGLFLSNHHRKWQPSGDLFLSFPGLGCQGSMVQWGRSSQFPITLIPSFLPLVCGKTESCPTTGGWGLALRRSACMCWPATLNLGWFFLTVCLVSVLWDRHDGSVDIHVYGLCLWIVTLMDMLQAYSRLWIHL